MLIIDFGVEEPKFCLSLENDLVPPKNLLDYCVANAG